MLSDRHMFDHHGTSRKRSAFSSSAGGFVSLTAAQQTPPDSRTASARSEAALVALWKTIRGIETDALPESAC